MTDLELVLENKRAWAVEVGDSMEVLRKLPDESVHVVVTSPPYWTLRNYGIGPTIWPGPGPMCLKKHDWWTIKAIRGSGGFSTAGDNARRRQIRPPRSTEAETCTKCGAWRCVLGDEPDPDIYVWHMVLFFREVRRVLRSDGTCWMNLGDAYNGSGGSGGDYAEGGKREGQRRYGPKHSRQLKRKDKALLPHAVALALREPWLTCPECEIENHRTFWWNRPMTDQWFCPNPLCGFAGRTPKMTELGWWIRQDNVWDKPNASIDSTQDRPVTNHEFVFLMAKQEKRYFYDPYGFTEATTGRNSGNVSTAKFGDDYNRPGHHVQKRFAYFAPQDDIGKRVRSVWTMSPRAGGNNHHAAFPLELAERAIKLGTSKYGVCGICEAPVMPVFINCVDGFELTRKVLFRHEASPKATCEHSGSGAKIIPALVLDPFLGTGTTSLAAHMYGRRSIGIELSPEHAMTATGRLDKVAPMFNMVEHSEVR